MAARKPIVGDAFSRVFGETRGAAPISDTAFAEELAKITADLQAHKLESVALWLQREHSLRTNPRRDQVLTAVTATLGKETMRSYNPLVRLLLPTLGLDHTPTSQLHLQKHLQRHLPVQLHACGESLSPDSMRKSVEQAFVDALVASAAHGFLATPAQCVSKILDDKRLEATRRKSHEIMSLKSRELGGSNLHETLREHLNLSSAKVVMNAVLAHAWKPEALRGKGLSHNEKQRLMDALVRSLLRELDKSQKRSQQQS